MNSIFKPAAQLEFLEAIAWYDRRKPGLGREFALEVCNCLMDAAIHPSRYRKVRGKARIIRLKRFRSYSVYFVLENDLLSVLAVFHAARNPNGLNQRL